jgi:hypothetical protein
VFPLDIRFLSALIWRGGNEVSDYESMRFCLSMIVDLILHGSFLSLKTGEGDAD